MKQKSFILIVYVTIGLILSGCSLLKPDTKAVIQSLVLSDMIDELLINEEDSDLFSEDTTVSYITTTNYAASAKYSREQVKKEIISVDISEESGTATAEISLVVPGKVELFDTNSVLLTTKDATLYGKIIYNVVRNEEGDWKIFDSWLRLASEEDPPFFNIIALSPMPVYPGDGLIVNTMIFNQAGDTFRIVAHNPSGTKRCRLLDNGLPEFYDEKANDGWYSCYIPIRSEISPGRYRGVLKAVARGSILNPDVPVKISIASLNVTVEVVENE